MTVVDHNIDDWTKPDRHLVKNDLAEKICNGHLQWSSWTQRRMMRIGAPIAAIVCMLLFGGAMSINNSSVLHLSKDIESNGFSSVSVVYFSTIVSPA